MQPGVAVNGATERRFFTASHTAPPADPTKLDTVPTNTALNPDAADYAVTVRYRTTKSYGNILQKGQNKTVGGYWKFEQPNGIVSCLFKGSQGEQRTANSITPLNGGSTQWRLHSMAATPQRRCGAKWRRRMMRGRRFGSRCRRNPRAA